MRKVIRYLLEGNGAVPSFVESGGFYPLNEELVGISVDSSKRHVPLTVQVLTRQQLIDRVMLVETDFVTRQPLTLEQATSMVDSFLERHNLESYE